MRERKGEIEKEVDRERDGERGRENLLVMREFGSIRVIEIVRKIEEWKETKHDRQLDATNAKKNDRGRNSYMQTQRNSERYIYR